MNYMYHIDYLLIINFNSFIMKIKDNRTYDLNKNKFIHLQRNESSVLRRVDINDLNKKLNEEQRSNFFTTILIFGTCVFSLVVLSLISIKF
mgnify:FL=1|jgi:hypothetical protein